VSISIQLDDQIAKEVGNNTNISVFSITKSFKI
jgi:hypothetical protein